MIGPFRLATSGRRRSRGQPDGHWVLRMLQVANWTSESSCEYSPDTATAGQLVICASVPVYTDASGY